jgi:uncharacterized radical SAM superfamily protein
MTRCEVCGNSYDKAFTITAAGGQQHVFDSFECAAHALAPRCDHCGCRILGHGIEITSARKVFCCAHCAKQAGHAGVADRQ